jgi:23S rRNA pseudouridine955/2504/2580 synthase
VQKTYLLLVAGRCHFEHKTVAVPLKKNVNKSGERVVIVDTDGKPAKTIFKCLKVMGQFSLLEARPITGRTHQIRVHAAHINHPILGDDKYGSEASTKLSQTLKIRQLCLHALAIQFYLSSKSKAVGVCALLKESWKQVAERGM